MHYIIENGLEKKITEYDYVYRKGYKRRLISEGSKYCKNWLMPITEEEYKSQLNSVQNERHLIQGLNDTVDLSNKEE